ncbi:MAG: hypothetical protein WCR42_02575 [bacterium]
MENQIDSLKQSKFQEQNFHKIRIGLDYGFSTPYSGTVDYASIFGESALGFAEYSLKKKSYIYSEVIYCAYEMDKGIALMHYYGDWFDIPDSALLISKGKKTCKSYSYVLGYGFRSKSDYIRPAWRFGAGLIYNYNILDKYTITTPLDTLTIPKSTSSSIGLNFMFGFDVPILSDVFGFFSTINISSGIIGSKNSIGMQFTSATVLGFYFRI